MFHEGLRRMCILLLLHGKYCICLLGLFGLKYISSHDYATNFDVQVFSPPPSVSDTSCVYYNSTQF